MQAPRARRAPAPPPLRRGRPHRTESEKPPGLVPRTPPRGQAPNAFRQAYVYVVIGAEPDSADIEKVDRFRRAFEAHFPAATSGRATVDTRLN